MPTLLEFLKQLAARNILRGPGVIRGSLLLTVLWLGLAGAAQSPPDIRVSVQWAKDGVTSAAAPSQLVIPYPLIRKGRPLHESAMAALKSENARFVRYMPYCSHPRLSIAELRPPTEDRTFWDFSLIDPDLIAFLEATRGRDPILDFGPIPPWMFKGGDAVQYARDPDQVDWRKCYWWYTKTGDSAQLVDPTGQQVAEYFARIASWYTRGGFTDELGKYHSSGYHYELPWWGVLNEPDLEEGFTPEQYTRVYDAVVAAIRKVSTATKFEGERGEATPQFFEYFLDPHHHAPGTPLDMVSFHFYAVPAVGQSSDSWQYTVFDQLSRWTTVMAYVDAIRKRLSPTTRINIGELGTSITEDWFGAEGMEPVDTTGQTPKWYWNLAAAFYADAFIELSQSGADVVSASQLFRLSAGNGTEYSDDR